MTRRCPHHRVARWLGVAAILFAGCQAAAPGGRKERQTVQVDRIGGYVEFIARTRENDQKSKVGAGSLETKEEIFEENIKIETEGSVYHPNFLDYSLAGLFGLTQQDFEENSDGRKRSSGDDGDIYEYDFEGQFLKKKPYPGTVYARRERAIEPRPFLSSLETTTTNYGFVWQYVDLKMPTTLQCNTTNVVLKPLDDEEDDGKQDNSQARLETEYRFSDQNVLSFQYDRLSVKEEPFGLEYDSDEIVLGHRLDFGDRHRNRLESELSYFDQRGTFDIRRTRFREILRLWHTETLKSWYQLEYLDRDQGSLSGVPPIREKSVLLSGNLEHQLYESLVSQLYAFGQRQDYESGLEIIRYGLQPGFDYRKRNPWGVLMADYRFRWQREDHDGGAQRVEVVDERHAFVDPEPVVLAVPNIVMTSITITAEDRLTVYRSGEDYFVHRVGNTTEIERVPTGRIRDGETVLIDYVYVFGGDYTLDTVSHDVGIRQRFDLGLVPYYRHRHQDQDLSPKDAAGILPDDITANIVGVEYQRGAVRAVAEYEDHKSTINPFTALRLNTDLLHRLEGGATARLRARWTDLDRSGDQDRQTRFFTVEGRYRHPLTKRFTVESTVLYRTEDDSESGDDEGIDVDVILEWSIRETEVRVTYEFGKFEDDFADTRNSALFVQARRRF